MRKDYGLIGPHDGVDDRDEPFTVRTREIDRLQAEFARGRLHDGHRTGKREAESTNRVGRIRPIAVGEQGAATAPMSTSKAPPLASQRNRRIALKTFSRNRLAETTKTSWVEFHLELTNC
jgi:hypothetical protein